MKLPDEKRIVDTIQRFSSNPSLRDEIVRACDSHKTCYQI